MAKSYALLIGNDINNIDPRSGWKDLLDDICKYCNDCEDLGAVKTILEIKYDNKPFPLVYEEIFLRFSKSKALDEKQLKRFISDTISNGIPETKNVKQNQIHTLIQQLDTNDIITTNYDFRLEGKIPAENKGLITEKVYSVFRHYVVSEKKYWHIHGDCKSPDSINLGFEHYGGQLQRIRNYVVSGVAYKSNKITKIPLIRRLTGKGEKTIYSWVDLFFTTDICIFGLSLDFVETDLWWLLTYRARQIAYNKEVKIQNNIFYFIPQELATQSQAKIDLLEATNIRVIHDIPGIDKLEYYKTVIEKIAHGLNK